MEWFLRHARARKRVTRSIFKVESIVKVQPYGTVNCYYLPLENETDQGCSCTTYSKNIYRTTLYYSFVTNFRLLVVTAMNITVCVAKHT